MQPLLGNAIQCWLVLLADRINAGNPDNVGSNQEKSKGVSTNHFAQTQSEQKVHSGSKFLKAQLGDEKGK